MSGGSAGLWSVSRCISLAETFFSKFKTKRGERYEGSQ